MRKIRSDQTCYYTILYPRRRPSTAARI